MSIYNKFSKYYLLFSVVVILVLAIIATGVWFVSVNNIKRYNLIELERSANNISNVITESLDYTNQVNINIGQRIANHGEKDLKFILNEFREFNDIKRRNPDLFSWSSFDWVNNEGYQVVNSRLGIHKNPINISERRYTKLAPQKPWTLQVSFPVLGIPSRSWVIPVGTGVMDSNGKYLGIISMGFDISEFTKIISQKLDKEISFVVLDNKMNIIMKSNDVNLPRDSNFFKQIANDGAMFLAELKILKEEILVGDIGFGFYERSLKYPYIILTGFNKSVINSRFNNLRLPYIIGILLIATFFLIILYVFGLKLVTIKSSHS